MPENETYNGSTVQVVRDIKTAVDGRPGVLGVTGVGALQLDYQNGVYGTFPLVLALLVVVTYILLVRAFRSLLVPLKAIILNLASLAATFGGVVLFWQNGWGSKAVFGVAPTGSITFWLPIMIFAFLFGLSMDYEVFILSRIREEYDRTGSTNRAVIEGVGRTGRLVTSAALILFLAFLSLASGPETDIKTFATALGFGILLDATVVRMLLVPALVSLFGEWNWYLPPAVARILRIKEPDHPIEAPVAAAVEAPGVRLPAPAADSQVTTLAGRPNTALLVIDVQNQVVDGSHERDAVVANVAGLVDRARREKVPVVWVQHNSDEIVRGTDGWRFVPELAPGESEPLVEKRYGDSFEDTPLESVLADLGVGRLVVVGAQTDACVRSTLHGAFARGYDATLVSDAHTTEDLTEYGAPPPDKVIAHTNLYWQYQTAPGRTAGTVATKDVDFSAR